MAVRIRGQLFVPLAAVRSYTPDPWSVNAGIAKGEEAMLDRYWEQVGGTRLDNYPLTKTKTATSEIRRADSIFLPKAAKRKCHWQDCPNLEFESDLIVVQAKVHRLGPMLAGQALFSRELIRIQNPNARGVALCGATEPLLEQALKRFGIDVVVDSRAGCKPEPLLTPDRDKIERFWRGAGKGTLVEKFRLPGGHKSHAIILPNRPFRRAHFWEIRSIEGEDVIIVTSRNKRLGMYVMGYSVFFAELARLEKPKSVQSIVLVNSKDDRLDKLLAHFPLVKVI